jgi:Mn2+/Fe2+ NRAMP family transporter
MTTLALTRTARWSRALAVAGPGLVVMLADTDAGSVVTAAQSGAQWGYRLLLLQAVLVPVLFIVQELAVRLGIVTGKSYGELIAQHFGRHWARLAAAGMIVACMGALVTELSGLASVGGMFGVAGGPMLAMVVLGLCIMAGTGSYRSVERIALALGAFEIVFVLVALKARPDSGMIAQEMLNMPLGNPSYLMLLSANIGAVIMPWMVFFHQSSVVEKRLGLQDLRAARWDTAVGALATQIIMAAVLILAAVSVRGSGQGASLTGFHDLAKALAPFLGPDEARLLFGMGLAGASLVATIVVTLTAARAAGDLFGFSGLALEKSPREAPGFYIAYALTLAGSALVVLSGVDQVALGVGVEVMNTLLLPLVLGFLYLLARRLPGEYRLRGGYAVVCALTMGVTAGLGVLSASAGFLAGA